MVFNPEEEKEKSEHRLREYMAQYGRPYRMCSATIERYGAKWACRHAGVEAIGDTPSQAAENFDHIWVFGDKEK